MAEVCPIHQDDKRYRPVGNGETTGTQRSTVIQTIYFVPATFLSRKADFFDLKRETNDTATDVWRRIFDLEKNCVFGTITAAELLASKFLSLIGKSTEDYELKKKFRKSDMSVEAITDAIHGYMYEKL